MPIPTSEQVTVPNNQGGITTRGRQRKHPDLAAKAKTVEHYDRLVAVRDARAALKAHQGAHHCAATRDAATAHTKASQGAVRDEHDQAHEALEAAEANLADYLDELRRESIDRAEEATDE